MTTFGDLYTTLFPPPPPQTVGAWATFLAPYFGITQHELDQAPKPRQYVGLAELSTPWASAEEDPFTPLMAWLHDRGWTWDIVSAGHEPEHIPAMGWTWNDERNQQAARAAALRYSTEFRA